MNANTAKSSSVTEISVTDLHKRLEKDPKLCIIDVREQDEWDNGHLAFALHVPKDSLTTRIKDLVPNKNQAIFLHCHAGRRSAIAAQELINAGYTEVYSVAGGLKAWIEHGFALA